MKCVHIVILGRHHSHLYLLGQAVQAFLPGSRVIVKVPIETVHHFAWAEYQPTEREDGTCTCESEIGRQFAESPSFAFQWFDVFSLRRIPHAIERHALTQQHDTTLSADTVVFGRTGAARSSL